MNGVGQGVRCELGILRRVRRSQRWSVYRSSRHYTHPSNAGVVNFVPGRSVPTQAVQPDITRANIGPSLVFGTASICETHICDEATLTWDGKPPAITSIYGLPEILVIPFQPSCKIAFRLQSIADLSATRELEYLLSRMWSIRLLPAFRTGPATTSLGGRTFLSR
jgi:hypothetical protein